MPSMLARKAAVISAVGQLAELEDFQSIMITQQGTSGVYFVALVTPSLDTYAMTLEVSTEGQVTYASRLRMTSSER